MFIMQKSKYFSFHSVTKRKWDFQAILEVYGNKINEIYKEINRKVDNTVVDRFMLSY